MRLAVVVYAVLVAAVPVEAQPQEPATRAEVLQREREEKAATLEPPAPNRLERILMALENDRAFERLLNPAEGFYPKIGNVTAGSGIAAGPAYRRPGLVREQADFNAFAIGSIQKYWMLEARLVLPRLADETIFAEVYARRFDFPDEDFFGLGPQSNRGDESVYGLESAEIGASGGVRPAPWLSLGTAVTHMSPRIDGSGASNAIDRVFDAADIPGFLSQPDFVRSALFADVNYRQPRGNPRQGGQYVFSVERFSDRDGGQFTFNRFEADLQQYISLLRNRRVLALHGHLSMSDAVAGAEIPFYLQRTLGGPDDLRGFRRFRFRDRNVLLLQAEYRWEIFTAVDGAIFYDAGKVASSRDDLDLRDLESDYGIGFRFGTSNGVFLRVEGAFGSAGGKHFIFRFGHVF